jgi:leader peptidase (prepilin peptidase)/N-methyltransferase
MTIFMAYCFFGFGLIFGSFFNVVGMRVSANQSVIYPTSHCLVYCTEAITGLLFLWIYFKFGLTLAGLNGIILVSLSIIITVSDLKYRLIPNKVLLFFFPILVIVRFLFPISTLWNHLLGAVVGGGIIVLIVILSRGGMGLGDAKLFILCGWAVGVPHILLALFIASLIGSLIGGILLLLKIVKRKQPIPFGPYLALGSLIAYGYGSDLIRFYLSILDNGLRYYMLGI